MNPTATYTAYRTYNVTLTASANGKSTSQTKQVVVVSPPLPEVTVIATPMSIFLPNNCAPTFVIRSSGPAGTLLSYMVKNSTPLIPGQLVFTNPSGILLAGSSVTIAVTVDPSYIYISPSLVGTTLGITVETPNAFNTLQTFLSVEIRAMSEQALNLLGIWGGTWTGNRLLLGLHF